MDEAQSEIGLESFTILHRGYKKIYPVLLKLETLLIIEKDGEADNKPMGTLFEKSESRDKAR